MTEFESIRQNSGTNPSQCSCSKCANMCKRCPCIGTPEDILRLINNGHIDKLKDTLWGTGTITFGWPAIDMVMAKRSPTTGHCSFLTEDNLCTLHSAGIKPTEGKLVSHADRMIPGKLPPGYLIALTWQDTDNHHTIELITKAMRHYRQTKLKMSHKATNRIFTP